MDKYSMKQIYLFLAAMLLLCLAPMPYGYFMLVRLVATIVFGLMAYRYYQSGKSNVAYVLGVLALLFQPMYKIALGRTVWNVVDVLVAIFLIVLFFIERRSLDKTYVTVEPVDPDTQNRDEKNEIEFKAEGKLAPKELLFVASEEDKALTDFFDAHPEVIEGWGQMIGFHIIYLPLLMKRLKDKRVLQYRAPYLTDEELTEVVLERSQDKNDFLLQYLEHPKDKEKIKQGFIRTENVHKGSDGKDKATNRFYPLSSKNGESLGDQLHRIGKQISQELGQHGRLLENKDTPLDVWNSVSGSSGTDVDSQDIDVSDDELMKEVRERIAKLRQRGIAEYVLEQLIHPDNRLSRLVVTKDGRILLPDYNNMEIKMEPLVKAVYLLFLGHPEGIAFKHLPDYREELTRIYAQLRPTGMTEKALQSIEDVTNPMLNSINEKCARIRAAFVGQFDDYMAQSYYIDGPRGGIKKIELPRNLVTSEW